jgi:hypothetical protein
MDRYASSIVKVAAVVRVVVSLIVRLVVVIGSSVVALEDRAWPCACLADVDGEGDERCRSNEIISACDGGIQPCAESSVVDVIVAAGTISLWLGL